MGIKNAEWGTATFGGRFMKKLLAQPAGFLVVLWGWSQFLGFMRYYLVRLIPLSFATCKTLEYFTNGLGILVFLFTLNYLYVHRVRLKRPEVKTLLTIWIGLFLTMVFTNVIMQNVLHHVVFELQHSLFMLLTALAIVITGSLIKNRWMWIGGLLFALLAFGSSYLVLKNQMLLEAIGWLVGFVIPGHLMLRRK
ncbi:MAG TPA: hypothetical protein VFP20_10640 [Bacteroidales bacterium]|nr:hypothetical protein [Bacteroidales bacterium]